MKNYTNKQNKIQHEIIKSRFVPEFANAPSKDVSCVGCGGRLDGDSGFQQAVKVCRRCLAHYAKVDLAIDAASKRKRRELLEKIAGGAK